MICTGYLVLVERLKNTYLEEKKKKTNTLWAAGPGCRFNWIRSLSHPSLSRELVNAMNKLPVVVRVKRKRELAPVDTICESSPPSPILSLRPHPNLSSAFFLPFLSPVTVVVKKEKKKKNSNATTCCATDAGVLTTTSPVCALTSPRPSCPRRSG